MHSTLFIGSKPPGPSCGVRESEWTQFLMAKCHIPLYLKISKETAPRMERQKIVVANTYRKKRALSPSPESNLIGSSPTPICDMTK